MNAPSPIRNLLVVLSIAAICASAVPASAETPVVLHRSLPPQFQVAGTKFDVDEGTGLVRLAFDVFDFTWEGSLVRTETIDVPGLRFDRERREVLYQNGGSVVTCATRKKFLWATSYPATDACRINVRSEVENSGMTDWVVEVVTDEPAKTAELSKEAGPS
jgi:hypothetical protein